MPDACCLVTLQVTYNGRTMDDFVVERASTYIEQVDEHMAELTCASCCWFLSGHSWASRTHQ